MSYLDFELEIGVGSGREYPVVVIRSAGGEAQEIMCFPFDDLALESQLKDLQIALLRSGGKRRQILSPIEQTVQNFGRALFNALFTGEVRSRYEVSQLAAFQQGKGLRLKLRINSPEMAALPWEFLYDANKAEYLCLSSNTPIVRYIELPQPPQPLTVPPPLSILGMAVGPKDLADLDIEREKQRVERAIESLRATNLVNLTWLAGQTWQHLLRAMRSGPWHIFHFIGHGGFDVNTDEGLIALTDDVGQSVYLSATKLGRLLADHRSLRLVVLNSCEGARGSSHDIFSSTASILVRRGLPAVLAMQYEITDQAAIGFSRAFYEALADGTPVDMAVSEARKAISIGIGNTVEWGTPVLYMRSSDGVLFDLIKKPSIQEEQPDRSANVKTSSEQPSIETSVPKLQPLPLHTSSEKLPTSTKGIEIFFCYAHEDEALLKKLKAHLIPLQRQRVIDLWHDRDISAGSEWEQEINQHLNAAQIILPLVSPDFMASDYCYGIEMKRALERHQRGEARVIPIILRPVYWQGILGNLQALPTDAKPVKSWSDVDKALFDVIEGIRKVVVQLGPKPSFSSEVILPQEQKRELEAVSLTVLTPQPAKHLPSLKPEAVSLLRTLTGHTGIIYSVAFSPGGQTVASGSNDWTIKLWNLASGQGPCILAGHTGSVLSVAISPDGQTVASGSWDETIRIWGMN